MNDNEANLNLVNGVKNEKSRAIQFKCTTKVWTLFSVKIERGGIDENCTLEQLIDLLCDNEILFCSNNPNQ